ncbi:hypothetical protein K1T71_004219 [Dendrolimus kikuchii]|uniref:Uncharacterized protein n=1 Tax=Dendrolimus kikuchii TaxID=765133 RepID=A0ACC1DAF8_9NEOP|nr:hypothetical protein K1T71_004219 [Dendrolimus kikuchii]
MDAVRRVLYFCSKYTTATLRCGDTGHRSTPGVFTEAFSGEQCVQKIVATRKLLIPTIRGTSTSTSALLLFLVVRASQGPPSPGTTLPHNTYFFATEAHVRNDVNQSLAHRLRPPDVSVRFQVWVRGADARRARRWGDGAMRLQRDSERRAASVRSRRSARLHLPPTRVPDPRRHLAPCPQTVSTLLGRGVQLHMRMRPRRLSTRHIGRDFNLITVKVIN